MNQRGLFTNVCDIVTLCIENKLRKDECVKINQQKANTQEVESVMLILKSLRYTQKSAS